MEKQLITNELLLAFSEYLQSNERAPGTIEKYLRDVSAFRIWLGNRSVTKELTAEWKERLLENNHAPVTVNSMLAAVNSFFRFAGWEAICGTGVRVSEVRYLTVEAVQAGRADISLKGKIRTILIPNKLCRKLLKYARKQKITSGEIFLTRSGKGMSRRQIWAEMKSLCERAGVEPSKVFPHNLRHVFAAAFYKSCKDIVRLADVLGHSSVETTRIYLLTTGVEHAQMLERLGLVL